MIEADRRVCLDPVNPWSDTLPMKKLAPLMTVAFGLVLLAAAPARGLDKANGGNQARVSFPEGRASARRTREEDVWEPLRR